jgi:hypothetical protein
MARHKTVTELLDDLRAETRQSLNVSHNRQIRDTQLYLLQSEQERLWTDFDWPHLRVERYLKLAEGQRFYEPPDLAIDRIEKIEVKYGATWVPLVVGIGAQQYNAWDSTEDQRSWPVERWRIYEDEQVEVWPIPSQNGDDTEATEGWLKFTGIRQLNPLVDDSDRCDLDARLIVLFAAVQMLTDDGKKAAAEVKLAAANAHYARLKSRLSPAPRFRLYGGSQTSGAVMPRGPKRVAYRVV